MFINTLSSVINDIIHLSGIENIYIYIYTYTYIYMHIIQEITRKM